MLPDAVAQYLAAHGHGLVSAVEPAPGGCIANGRALTTSSGGRFFLKTLANAPADMFTREAEGLAALAAASGGPRVPKVFLAGTDFILLELLAPAPPAPDYWATFGVQLAQLHAETHDQFGFAHDNYLGLTPQPNPWDADGHHFFAEHRLGCLGRRCRERGLLAGREAQQLERLIARLPGLIPAQPASLLHGDLWSGNVVTGPDGQACLIDPAAHFGWAEADLAMLTLFGHVPQAFFAAYEATRPLTPGYRDRFDLYNLYHLLNHWLLFGGAYEEAVRRIIGVY
jgi:protein-ribulosamine 3-kinase